MEELPVRKKIRLKGHDYRDAGYYFITICIKDERKLLGRVVGTTAPGRPHVELTPLGVCVDETIKIANRNNVKIDKYMIMPNHIHMIVILEQGTDDRGRSSLQQVVRNIKSFVTKQCGVNIWQPRFHDHIIRNEPEYQKIWQYIDTNPAKWDEDYYFIKNKFTLKMEDKTMCEQERNLKIEDDIQELFEGALRINSLDFISCLHENQLTPRNCGEKYWKVPFNGYNICGIWLKPNEIYISFFLSYLQEEYNGECSDEFNASIHKHVGFCSVCHDGCTGPFNVPIFGKEFKNVCSQHTVDFVNPDANTFKHIKALVEYCKKIEPNNISYHVRQD